MIVLRVIFVVALISVTAGCISKSNDNGFKSSNLIEMERIKQELTAHHIPYREDELGYVRYDQTYHDEVNAIRRAMDNTMSVKYSTPTETQLAVKAMEEIGVQVTVEARPDGQWVVWSPSSADQQRAVEARVNQALFEASKK